MQSLFAYLDTFSGLVPCKVLCGDPRGGVRVKVTATRGAYKRGELVTMAQNWVYPRDCLRRVRGSYGTRISLAPYDWNKRLSNLPR